MLTVEEARLVVSGLTALRADLARAAAAEVRNIRDGHPLDPRPGRERAYLQFLYDDARRVRALRKRMESEYGLNDLSMVAAGEDGE